DIEAAHGGDLADATIDLSTYSEANARENADVPFHIKIGDTVIGASGEAISMNGATMTLTASNGHLA
ncbi:MAG: hypothetical protein J0H80_24125, partial [Rhizobiales bacterium]|nr:hypothetical protein [Hyphomicrobiales bacterium]